VQHNAPSGTTRDIFKPQKDAVIALDELIGWWENPAPGIAELLQTDKLHQWLRVLGLQTVNVVVDYSTPLLGFA
jgi:hypothetical protein